MQFSTHGVIGLHYTVSKTRCSLLFRINSLLHRSLAVTFQVKDIFRHGCKHEEDIAQELFLDSNVDAHVSEDKILPHERDRQHTVD
jgi:hypothetical protein